MKASPKQEPATPESVWEAFRETDRLMKESEAKFKSDMAELDKKFAETDRFMKESEAKFYREMKESEEKFYRILAESSAKFDRDLAESSAKFDRDLAESSAKFDRDLEKSRNEYDRRTKNLEQRMGAWSNSHGSFAEEYFFNAFDNGETTFFGEKFDDIAKNVKALRPKIKDEYDIVFINCKSIGIIEIKYKAHENDVHEVVNKANTFKANYPDFSNHKFYLGLASMSFYPELEEKCKKNGIAVIKQVGDTVVINDKHLKVY